MLNIQNKVVIVASFDKRNLQSAILWLPKAFSGLRHSSVEFEMIDEKYPEAIHFYDAAPSRKPQFPSKMITFTSPDPDCISSIRNIERHRFLYMDVWTIEELQKANELLEKKLPLREKISEDEVQSRYEWSYCLTSKDL